MRAPLSSRARDPRSGPFAAGSGLGPAVGFEWSPGGRLSLTSGTPVTTSDVTGATTLYYTEHEHAFLPAWNGRRWVARELPVGRSTTARQLELPLGGVASGSVYDVFARDGQELVLGPAWSSATARARALSRALGRHTLEGDPRLLYLGTIYGSGSGTVEDSATKRFCWNAYQRRLRNLRRIETTASWTYSTASWQQANNSSSNQVEVVTGLAEDAATLRVYAQGYSTTDANASVGIGVSSSTVNSADLNGGAMASNQVVVCLAASLSDVRAGYRSYRWLECGQGAPTQTWFGPWVGDNRDQFGISGEVWA